MGKELDERGSQTNSQCMPSIINIHISATYTHDTFAHCENYFLKYFRVSLFISSHRASGSCKVSNSEKQVKKGIVTQLRSSATSLSKSPYLSFHSLSSRQLPLTTLLLFSISALEFPAAYLL